MIKKILEWTILGGLAASYLGVLAYINWPRMLKKILGYTILAGLAASYLVALAYIIDFLQGLAIIGGVVLVIGLLILGIWLGRPMGAAIFGGQCPTSAKLEATMQDGSKYTVELWLHELSFNSESAHCYSMHGNSVVIKGTPKGPALFEPAVPVKPVKVKKIKPPTVKASATKMRKADRVAAALAKQESILEAKLRVTKMKKEEAEKERAVAKEALLIAAVA